MIVVFVVALLWLTVFVMAFAGNTWGKSVWSKMANVLPLTVIKVEGESVKQSTVKQLQNLGILDAEQFTIQRVAIYVLAQDAGIDLDPEEIEDQKYNLLAQWDMSLKDFEHEIQSMGVAPGVFDEFMIGADILADKLAIKLNVLNDRVKEVEQLLINGAEFGYIANEYSNDPISVVLDGDTGFVARHEVHPRIWEVASTLAPSQWSGPVTIPQGHVFIKKLGWQDNPERHHLQFIFVKGIDFEAWLLEQIANMRVKILI